MGDGDSLKLSSSYESAPLSNGEQGRTALRVTYSGKGGEGWAGIYWLTPANNWGTTKGAGFNLTGAKRLTFWVRGDKGGERISEVAIGGISSGSYPDSDRVSVGPLKLSTKWEQYAIDLDGKDLRHIIGGFVFVVKRADNISGARFYLDEIVFEGNEIPNVPATAEPVAESTAPVMAAPINSAPVIEVPAASTKTVVLPAVSTEPVKRVIAFDSAKNAFGNEAMILLNEILLVAKDETAKKVLVEGHTDTVGSAAANLTLSQKRAKAAADYLIANGVDARKISIKGLGESKPLMPEDGGFPDVARRQNRRVEITVQRGEKAK